MGSRRQLSATRRITAAAVYARISRDKYGDAPGVARQEALCRALAEAKGWPVAECYVDNDLSAYNGKPRPAYERMLADVEAGKRDAVVCVDLDRLTRQPMEVERFIELADRMGIALANVSGDTDLSSSDGRFKARILGAVARQESEKKSERLKRQRADIARRGLPQVSYRPFGFERDGITIRSDEAALIVDAASRFIRGESIASIVREWTRIGVVTGRGKNWTGTTLRKFLRNPRLAGRRRYRPLDRLGRVEFEAVYEAVWLPILDVAMFERVQRRFKELRRNRRPGYDATYLLSSVLKCGRCGSVMHHSTRPDRKNIQRVYICAWVDGGRTCGRMVVSAERAEAGVREFCVVAAAQALTAGDEDAIQESRVRQAWESNGLPWRRKLVLSLFDWLVIHPPIRPHRFDIERIQPVWRVNDPMEMGPEGDAGLKRAMRPQPGARPPRPLSGRSRGR